MDVVAFIFARGGSKGLPNKNIRVLDGKPLIGWAIESALAVSRIRRLIVSTDSEKIAEIALKFGAEVPFFRPADLASDSSPEWLSWRHALTFLKADEGRLPDAMVSVPATAPLRMPQDIDNCLDLFSAGDADAVVTVTEAHRNPYFNMVQVNQDGTVRLVASTNESHSRRQDAPLVYDMTTVAYVVKPDFVFLRNSIFDGRVKAAFIPIERAIDIDTVLDYQIAEYYVSQRIVRNNVK